MSEHLLPPQQPVPSYEQRTVPVELIIYTANMFAEGSLGRIYFPELLEGRTRPNILEKTPPETVNGTALHELPKLSYSQTYRNIFDLHQTDIADLSAYRQKLVHDVASENAEVLGKKLLYTPYERLLHVALGVYQYTTLPVAIEDEHLVQEAIEAFLQRTLDERDRGIIIERWGLDDWQVKTTGDVGEKFGLTSVRIQQIEKNVLGKLRGFANGTIRSFATNPIKSFAADMGIRYVNELPTVTSPLVPREIFSEDELAALSPVVTSWHYGSNYKLQEVLRDHPKEPLPTDLKNSILAKIERFVRVHKAEAVFGEDLAAIANSTPEDIAIAALTERALIVHTSKEAQQAAIRRHTAVYRDIFSVIKDADK